MDNAIDRYGVSATIARHTFKYLGRCASGWPIAAVAWQRYGDND